MKDDMLLWEKLKEHRGNRVEIITYGDWDNPMCIALEDMDTNEVILDAEIYTICPRREHEEDRIYDYDWGCYLE